jgi:DNA-directed RNA polymerase specialized sigma24 family protein
MTDRERLEAAFRAHYRDVAAYCLRRCASPEDAEEAATEVFATAWRRIAKLPPEPAARLWLFGVARNVVANQRRTEHRRERLRERLREAATRPGDATPAGVSADARGADPADVVAARSGAILAAPGGAPLACAAAEALAALSPGDRELVLLSAWEGLAPREIARVLGLPAPVVSARLYRARRRLAAGLTFSGELA